MGTIVDTSKVKSNMPKSKVELEILKKLDAFGESVLDSHDARGKHVKKKRKLEDTITEGISRSKKKKLKKKNKASSKMIRLKKMYKKNTLNSKARNGTWKK